jgi:hypothetical protein
MTMSIMSFTAWRENPLPVICAFQNSVSLPLQHGRVAERLLRPGEMLTLVQEQDDATGP